MGYLGVDPMFDGYRQESQFHRFMQCAGLR
jgi:hypothetical protein